MLCFSFEQVETKKYQKPSLRDINHAGVLVVYGWCTWGGGGGDSLEWPIQGYAAGQGMVFYLPPRPPWGAVMLVMTTDAQERKQQNFTRQHNAITQRRHVFGNNHDILMNPFY